MKYSTLPLKMKLSRVELKRILSPRIFNGKLNVPKDEGLALPKEIFENHFEEFKCWYHKGYHEDYRSHLKKFFFSQAVVPKSLQLLKVNRALVEQELDLCDHYICFQSKKDTKLDAILACAMWQKDENYEAFPVEGLDWVAVASEIANEEANDDDEMAFSIWRDFHYQMLYHFAQRQIQWCNAQSLVYFAFGFKTKGADSHQAKPARNEGMNRVYQIVQTLPIKISGLFSTTLPGHREVFASKSPFLQEISHIPYISIPFERRGNRVFKKLASDDVGITIFGSCKSNF